MPIEHLVCMKLRKPVAESQVTALCRECEEKLCNVPGVISASIGANFNLESSSEFTHALVVRLADRRALDAFLADPYHLEAGELMMTVFSDFLIVDYETERY